MDKDQLIKKLMVTFLEELEEHVHSLNADLLALEKAAEGTERAERLTTLFRTAHSLKGAARSVNVTLLEEACHHLEELLAAARDRAVALDANLFALLFATADAIEEAGMRLREQQDLTDAPLSTLLPRLEVASGKPGGHSAVTLAQPPLPPRKVVSSPPAPPPAPSPQERAAMPPAPETAFAPIGADAVADGAGAGGTVRVLAEKLDTLLAQSGELLLAR